MNTRAVLLPMLMLCASCVAPTINAQEPSGQLVVEIELGWTPPTLRADDTPAGDLSGYRLECDGPGTIEAQFDGGAAGGTIDVPAQFGTYACELYAVDAYDQPGLRAAFELPVAPDGLAPVLAPTDITWDVQLRITLSVP